MPETERDHATPSPSTAIVLRGLVPAVGGEDERRVVEAVNWLASKKVQIEANLTQQAAEIGEYLIRRFFDNDLAEVSSQNPNKCMSFRTLCEHPDVPYSASALRRFIQVAINFRLMPPDTAAELPPSHHSILYHVADEGERIRIACLAAEESLSAQRLRDIVKGKGRRRPGAGRKGRPRWRKDWEQMVALARQVHHELVSAADAAPDDPDLLAEARRLRDMVTDLVDHLAGIPDGEHVPADARPPRRAGPSPG